MNRVIILALVLLMVLILVGCGRNKVERFDTQSPDLSGRWNDTDASLVSQEMIKDILSRPWYSDFLMKYDRKPVIIVGAVRNKSDEHIDTEVFINDIERELINSGQVKFVASPAERYELRDEVASQQENATAETAKQLAAETGADLMLQGSINTITDAVEGARVIVFKTDLQLINLQNSEKVWIGTKEIKKGITKPGYKL